MIETAAWAVRDGLMRSPTLEHHGLVAGFSTRAMGSMAGSHHPLEEQERNRAALARRLGFDAVVRMKQVHGNDVVHVDGPRDPWPVADAMWTERAGVLLGVAAADCVPVLIADPGGPLGVAHAGWEGTTRRVARRLVEALRAAGSDPARLVAALGPSIGPCCYEVGADRAATIRERLGAAAAFAPYGAGIAFDLWSTNVAQLRDAGVERIEVAGTCTKCGGANTWSRRGGDVGLLGLAFIGRRA